MKSSYLAYSVAILTALFLFNALARADTLLLRDSKLYGKVVSVEQKDIIFKPNCGEAIKIPKGDVQKIVMNGTCEPRPIRPYSAGGDICENPLSLYEITLTDGKKIVASDFQLDEKRLHYRSPNGLVTHHGEANRIQEVTRRLFCRDEIPSDLSPFGFCTEDTRFAANFGFEPVFANRILTRGISFYLQYENDQPISVDDPIGEIIRESFSAAITVWMGAILDRKDKIPNEAQAAISPLILHSNGDFQLLMPPQVVQVGCPDTASFVIRYFKHDQQAMIVDGRPKAARAEVEGRTLWINGVKYPCWKSSMRDELIITLAANSGTATGTCFNLVPIIVHELGHALGLPGHHDIDGRPSIMDSKIRWPYLRPTAEDVDELVQVLLRPIAGESAGRLDADGLGVEIAPQKNN